MSLLDLIADTESKERVLNFVESLLKEIEGINMALRDMNDLKAQELAILKKRCKLK